MIVPSAADKKFLNQAKEATKMSECKSRQVGAILVYANRVMVQSANITLPAYGRCDAEYGGCRRCEDSSIKSGTRLDECVCIHAETNLLGTCAMLGIKCDGLAMYTTHKPCMDCFKLITMAGIAVVTYEEDYPGFDYKEGNVFLRHIPNMDLY